MMKRVLLVVGGGYVLGFVGVFFVTLMEMWDLGPTTYVVGEALLRSLLWPYEIVKLFS